ncbi:MAG: phosphatidate cytidylyltransferase [Firmicutes bacterium]|nr:phosphatidate cytidylyltransferase [Bacillota bacterium]
MFKQRVVSALISIPLVLGAVWLGNYFFLFLIFIVSLLTLREWFSIFALQNKKLQILTYLSCILVQLLAYFFQLPGILLALLCFFLLLNLFWVLHYPLDFQTVLLTLWGQIHISCFLAFFLLLRNLPHGLHMVFSVLFAVWASDTGAYLCGIALGQHKMLPAVSPKKSWEGAAGGVIFAGLALGILAPYLQLNRFVAVLLGFSFSLVGQLGDLAESAVKRQAQVKDSGRFLPGHGGLFDRLDSLLFAAPVAYFIFTFCFF